MNYKTIVLFVVFLMPMIGCNSPLFQIAQEQGHEGVKEICLFHGDTISWIQTGNPNYKRLCKGHFFHYHIDEDSICTEFVMESGDGYGTIINGHINESIKDNLFLLAVRKPLDSIFGPLQTLPVPFDSNSTYLGRPQEPSTYDERWKMINDAPYHDYWIINQQTSDVYGPMSFEEYQQKREELGVPDNLRLKCEKER